MGTLQQPILLITCLLRIGRSQNFGPCDQQLWSERADLELLCMNQIC
jgi:hypothetical protein